MIPRQRQQAIPRLERIRRVLVQILGLGAVYLGFREAVCLVQSSAVDDALVDAFVEQVLVHFKKPIRSSNKQANKGGDRPLVLSLTTKPPPTLCGHV
jgi:hypothetical protein